MFYMAADDAYVARINGKLNDSVTNKAKRHCFFFNLQYLYLGLTIFDKSMFFSTKQNDIVLLAPPKSIGPCIFGRASWCYRRQGQIKAGFQVSATVVK